MLYLQQSVDILRQFAGFSSCHKQQNVWNRGSHATAIGKRRHGSKLECVVEIAGATSATRALTNQLLRSLRVLVPEMLLTNEQIIFMWDHGLHHVEAQRILSLLLLEV